MKLIVALGLREYQDQLIGIFNDQEVPIFSEVEIKGFHKSKKTPDLLNWFAGEVNPDYSLLFFAFTSSESSNKIMEGIENFNDRQMEGMPPFHAFLIDVEKYA